MARAILGLTISLRRTVFIDHRIFLKHAMTRRWVDLYKIWSRWIVIWMDKYFRWIGRGVA